MGKAFLLAGLGRSGRPVGCGATDIRAGCQPRLLALRGKDWDGGLLGGAEGAAAVLQLAVGEGRRLRLGGLFLALLKVQPKDLAIAPLLVKS